jgi:hypothetical protein
VTKKIRESFSTSTIRPNKNSIGRLWWERMFCAPSVGKFYRPRAGNEAAAKDRIIGRVLPQSAPVRHASGQSPSRSRQPVPLSGFTSGWSYSRRFAIDAVTENDCLHAGHYPSMAQAFSRYRKAWHIPDNYVGEECSDYFAIKLGLAAGPALLFSYIFGGPRPRLSVNPRQRS